MAADRSARRSFRPTRPILATAGVSKYFSSVRAVKDVTISIRRGEIMSVIGPNGAGKTSLLNMISGFYRPTSGADRVGRPRHHPRAPFSDRHLGVARTFQNIALFAGMTVLDNIMLGRHVHMRAGVFVVFPLLGPCQRKNLPIRAASRNMIDFLELQNIRKQPSAALPYGLRKRVELGRALALEPKVLLLDEPIGGMNQGEKEDMARFILEVNAQWGTTIILIEHDMAVVMDISDRVTVLDRGRKIAEGTPADGPEQSRSDPRLSRHRRSAGGGMKAATTLPQLSLPRCGELWRRPALREAPADLAGAELVRVRRARVAFRCRTGRADRPRRNATPARRTPTSFSTCQMPPRFSRSAGRAPKPPPHCGTEAVAGSWQP